MLVHPSFVSGSNRVSDKSDARKDECWKSPSECLEREKSDLYGTGRGQPSGLSGRTRPHSVLTHFSRIEWVASTFVHTARAMVAEVKSQLS